VAVRSAAGWVALRQAWSGLAPRERRLVWLAAVVVGMGLLVGVGLQPAWKTLREAPAQVAALEEQRRLMQSQAAEAARWRAVPPLPSGQAVGALQAAAARLAPRARLSVQGDRAVLSFEGLTPSELQAWWGEARAGARARPVEAQWSVQPAGLSGSLVVALQALP
jgi:general secretion pathway protein M